MAGGEWRDQRQAREFEAAVREVYEADVADRLVGAVGYGWLSVRVHALAELAGVDLARVLRALGEVDGWFAPETEAADEDGNARTVPAFVLRFRLEPVLARLTERAGGGAGVEEEVT